MTPQALFERRAWAREFEVEGFRIEGIVRDDRCTWTKAAMRALVWVKNSIL